MPDRGRAFLTAGWRDVLGFTWAVDGDRLAPWVPDGVQVDELDGAARVSLVAFRFADTRVRGVRIPGHVAFPEINLRFYVRRGDERAVVFLRELVPRRAVAAVARLRYNEPYERVPMRVSTWPDAAGELHIEHRFGTGLHQRVSAVASAEAAFPAVGSADHWLTHHALAFGRSRRGSTLIYTVEHPLWALHPVRSAAVEVDFAAAYGPRWAFLTGQEPSHVTLAVGSPVAVTPPALTTSA